VALRFLEKALKVTRCESGEVSYYLIEDPERGVSHRLYEMEYDVAQLLDGTRTVEKVAKLVNKRRKISLQPVDVEKFARQLLALGFVVEE
jgi:hypothetical protein